MNMFNNLTNVVKNLIIINVLMFLATQILGSSFIDNMAGHYFQAPLFRPWQVVTHMFMHGSFTHILFNMYALFMFGPRLEIKFGSKRFLIYYMLTGLGAVFLHYLVVHFQLVNMGAFTNPDLLNIISNDGKYNPNTISPELIKKFGDLYYGSVVGASGAVFGLLLAYGMTYPNDRIQLLFPPIPMKIKHFVIGYGVIELYMGIANSQGDNTAHFAHLGGMLFGYILIKLWNKNQNDSYQY